MKEPLKIASISDIHFGNKRILSLNIAHNISTFMFPKLEGTDLLIIGGDVFDTSLPFSDEHSNIIVSWIIDLLDQCEKYGVIVRILRGTFSHDRTQCTSFPLYHKKGRYKHSLRYFDTMSCEYIEELDLKVLYIPDDLPYKSSDECLDVIKKMLSDIGWQQVDYVFGHGYFEHMLPPYMPHKPKITFTVEQFKDIVRRFILMGHVHHPNKTDNVIFNGSFERLGHGEEEDKGFVYIEDFGRNANIEFVENKLSTKFLTFDLSEHKYIELAISKYEELMLPYVQEALIYIRVIHPSSEIRNVLSKITRVRYPNVNFSHISDGSAPTIIRISDILDTSDLPTPTIDLLPQMVYSYLNLKGKSPLSEERIGQLLETL